LKKILEVTREVDTLGARLRKSGSVLRKAGCSMTEKAGEKRDRERWTGLEKDEKGFGKSRVIT